MIHIVPNRQQSLTQCPKIYPSVRFYRRKRNADSVLQRHGFVCIQNHDLYQCLYFSLPCPKLLSVNLNYIKEIASPMLRFGDLISIINDLWSRLLPQVTCVIWVPMASDPQRISPGSIYNFFDSSCSNWQTDRQTDHQQCITSFVIRQKHQHLHQTLVAMQPARPMSIQST